MAFVLKDIDHLIRNNSEADSKIKDLNDLKALFGKLQSKKDKDFPFVHASLYIPRSAMEEVIREVFQLVLEEIMPDIESRAYSKGAATVRTRRPLARRRRQARRGGGAAAGAHDGSMLQGYNNTGAGIGGGIAYDTAYSTARDLRLQTEKGVKHQAEELAEHLFNSRMDGIAKLDIHYRPDPPKGEAPKESYFAFYDGNAGDKKTYFRRNIGVLDKLPASDCGEPFLRVLLAGRSVKTWVK